MVAIVNEAIKAEIDCKVSISVANVLSLDFQQAKVWLSRIAFPLCFVNSYQIPAIEFCSRSLNQEIGAVRAAKAPSH